MKKPVRLSKWIIFPAVVGTMVAVFTIGMTAAYFTDLETSSGSAVTAWTSALWTQTSEADYNSGVLSDVETSSSPGDAILSIVPNPTIVTSNNTEIHTDTSSSASWELVKTLYFTRSGSAYDELRIDTNLRVADAVNTVISSIRLNGAEILSNSNQSTSYVTYNDFFDFSGYADGDYTLSLYMQVNGGNAYNQLFEVYRTGPALEDSDDSEVYTTGDLAWHLKKTLTFTKSGTAYDNLRFDTNLRSTGNTAGLRIDINGTATFTYSTDSSSYVAYSDILDFSGYADGPYTVDLYLQIGNKNKRAYNSLFEIWTTDPILVAADNNEYNIIGTLEWQLMKFLVFTKSGTTYDEFRLDTNLHASSPATAYSSIRIDDVEVATHTTTSTTYIVYSDVIVTSGLSDGFHTLKLYMKSSNKNQPAYNSTFETYRTYTYAASGTLASAVFDTSVSESGWDALFWDESLPSGTDITLEVRASDTSFLKTAAVPSWTSAGETTPVLSGLPNGRYKQWRATLVADGARASTPVLQEIRTYYYGD